MTSLMIQRKGRSCSLHVKCRDHETKKCNNIKGYKKCRKAKTNCMSICAGVK